MCSCCSLRSIDFFFYKVKHVYNWQNGSKWKKGTESHSTRYMSIVEEAHSGSTASSSARLSRFPANKSSNMAEERRREIVTILRSTRRKTHKVYSRLEWEAIESTSNTVPRRVSDQHCRRRRPERSPMVASQLRFTLDAIHPMILVRRTDTKTQSAHILHYGPL